MEKELYEKNGNVLYILNVLKKYTDEEHKISIAEIQRKVKELYDVDIDSRTIRRNINLLKLKFDYDISTRDENGKGYYITRNPETDFETGEIRAIIDTFSYANYIVPEIGKSIIKKCKNIQNVYENEKIKDYKIYSKNAKTNNMEVIKNIEDITEAIRKKHRISFEYWKYGLNKGLNEEVVSTPTVDPYALVYMEQEFYLLAVKEGKEDLYKYRLDRIKNLKELEETRKIFKTQAQVKEYAESMIEAFAGNLEEITAICDNNLLNPVIDKFGKNITIEKIDEKTFKLVLDTDRDGFIYWALKNLREVEVIKPISLREEIKDIVKMAEEKYKIN